MISQEDNPFTNLLLILFILLLVCAAFLGGSLEKQWEDCKEKGSSHEQRWWLWVINSSGGSPACDFLFRLSVPDVPKYVTSSDVHMSGDDQ